MAGLHSTDRCTRVWRWRFILRSFPGTALGKISLDRALSLAASGVFAVFRETALSGSLELALIKAQDALANPPEVFPAQIL